MTNGIALAIGLLIVVLAIADFWLNGSGYLVFLFRKLADLVEWLAFWR